MKIAVYGITRSGKTTFVNKCINHLNKTHNHALHIKPSDILFKIANDELNSKYYHTSEKNMNYIHTKYLKIINSLKYNAIFFDCHCAYWDKNWQLYSILSEIDIKGYDKFIYLNTDSKTILTRLYLSDSSKHISGITLERIDKWKKYEISALINILKPINKNLEIINKKLDEDTILNEIENQMKVKM